MATVADRFRCPSYSATTSGNLLGASKVLVSVTSYGLELRDITGFVSSATSTVTLSPWDSVAAVCSVPAYAHSPKKHFPHWRLLRLSVSRTSNCDILVDVLPSSDITRVLVYQQALFVRWSLAVRQHLVAVTAAAAESIHSAVLEHRTYFSTGDDSIKAMSDDQSDAAALSCSDPAVRSRLAWLQDALCQGHAACGAAAVAAITGRAESPQACAGAWTAWLHASHAIVQSLTPPQVPSSTPPSLRSLPSLPPLPARPVPSGVKTKETLRMQSPAAAQQLVAAWQRTQQAVLLGQWLHLSPPSPHLAVSDAAALHSRGLLEMPPCIAASIPSHFKVQVVLPRSLEAVWDPQHKTWGMQPRLLSCSAQVLACDLVLRYPRLPGAHAQADAITVLPLSLVRRVLLSSGAGQGEWLQLLCAGGSRGGVTLHAENRNDLALAIQRAVSNVFDVELPLTHSDELLAPVGALKHIERGGHLIEGGALDTPPHMDAESVHDADLAQSFVCTSALGSADWPQASVPRPAWQHSSGWAALSLPVTGVHSRLDAAAVQLVFDVGFGAWDRWRPHVLAQWVVGTEATPPTPPSDQSPPSASTRYWAITGTHLLELQEWALQVQSVPVPVYWVHRVVTRATPLACIVALACTPADEHQPCGVRIVAQVPELQQQAVPAPLSPSAAAGPTEPGLGASDTTAPHIATAATASIGYASVHIHGVMPAQWRGAIQGPVQMRQDARAVHLPSAPSPCAAAAGASVSSTVVASHVLATVYHHARAVCAAAADGTVGAATLLLGPLLDDSSPLWVGPGAHEGIHWPTADQAVFDAWAVHDVAAVTASEMTDTLTAHRTAAAANGYSAAVVGVGPDVVPPSLLHLYMVAPSVGVADGMPRVARYALSSPSRGGSGGGSSASTPAAGSATPSADFSAKVVLRRQPCLVLRVDKRYLSGAGSAGRSDRTACDGCWWSSFHPVADTAASNDAWHWSDAAAEQPPAAASEDAAPAIPTGAQGGNGRDTAPSTPLPHALASPQPAGTAGGGGAATSRGTASRTPASRRHTPSATLTSPSRGPSKSAAAQPKRRLMLEGPSSPFAQPGHGATPPSSSQVDILLPALAASPLNPAIVAPITGSHASVTAVQGALLSALKKPSSSLGSVLALLGTLLRHTAGDSSDWAGLQVMTGGGEDAPERPLHSLSKGGSGALVQLQGSLQAAALHGAVLAPGTLSSAFSAAAAPQQEGGADMHAALHGSAAALADVQADVSAADWPWREWLTPTRGVKLFVEGPSSTPGLQWAYTSHAAGGAPFTLACGGAALRGGVGPLAHAFAAVDAVLAGTQAALTQSGSQRASPLSPPLSLLQLRLQAKGTERLCAALLQHIEAVQGGSSSRAGAAVQATGTKRSWWPFKGGKGGSDTAPGQVSTPPPAALGAPAASPPRQGQLSTVALLQRVADAATAATRAGLVFLDGAPPLPPSVELQCTAALLQHQGSAFALDSWQASTAAKWTGSALGSTAYMLPTHPLDALLGPHAKAAGARSAALVKAKQVSAAPPTPTSLLWSTAVDAAGANRMPSAAHYLLDRIRQAMRLMASDAHGEAAGTLELPEGVVDFAQHCAQSERGAWGLEFPLGKGSLPSAVLQGAAAVAQVLRRCTLSKGAFDEAAAAMASPSTGLSQSFQLQLQGCVGVLQRYTPGTGSAPRDPLSQSRLLSTALLSLPTDSGAPSAAECKPTCALLCATGAALGQDTPLHMVSSVAARLLGVAQLGGVRGHAVLLPRAVADVLCSSPVLCAHLSAVLSAWVRGGLRGGVTRGTIPPIGASALGGASCAEAGSMSLHAAVVLDAPTKRIPLSTQVSKTSAVPLTDAPLAVVGGGGGGTEHLDRPSFAAIDAAPSSAALLNMSALPVTACGSLYLGSQHEESARVCVLGGGVTACLTPLATGTSGPWAGQLLSSLFVSRGGSTPLPFHHAWLLGGLCNASAEGIPRVLHALAAQVTDTLSTSGAAADMSAASICADLVASLGEAAALDVARLAAPVGTAARVLSSSGGVLASSVHMPPGLTSAAVVGILLKHVEGGHAEDMTPSSSVAAPSLLLLRAFQLHLLQSGQWALWCAAALRCAPRQHLGPFQPSLLRLLRACCRGHTGLLHTLACAIPRHMLPQSLMRESMPVHSAAQHAPRTCVGLARHAAKDAAANAEQILECISRGEAFSWDDVACLAQGPGGSYTPPAATASAIALVPLLAGTSLTAVPSAATDAAAHTAASLLALQALAVSCSSLAADGVPHGMRLLRRRLAEMGVGPAQSAVFLSLACSPWCSEGDGQGASGHLLPSSDVDSSSHKRSKSLWRAMFKGGKGPSDAPSTAIPQQGLHQPLTHMPVMRGNAEQSGMTLAATPEQLKLRVPAKGGQNTRHGRKPHEGARSHPGTPKTPGTRSTPGRRTVASASNTPRSAHRGGVPSGTVHAQSPPSVLLAASGGAVAPEAAAQVLLALHTTRGVRGDQHTGSTSSQYIHPTAHSAAEAAAAAAQYMLEGEGVKGGHKRRPTQTSLTAVSTGAGSSKSGPISDAAQFWSFPRVPRDAASAPLDWLSHTRNTLPRGLWVPVVGASATDGGKASAALLCSWSNLPVGGWDAPPFTWNTPLGDWGPQAFCEYVAVWPLATGAGTLTVESLIRLAAPAGADESRGAVFDEGRRHPLTGEHRCDTSALHWLLAPAAMVSPLRLQAVRASATLALRPLALKCGAHLSAAAQGRGMLLLQHLWREAMPGNSPMAPLEAATLEAVYVAAAVAEWVWGPLAMLPGGAPIVGPQVDMHPPSATAWERSTAQAAAALQVLRACMAQQDATDSLPLPAVGVVLRCALEGVVTTQHARLVGGGSGAGPLLLDAALGVLHAFSDTELSMKHSAQDWAAGVLAGTHGVLSCLRAEVGGCSQLTPLLAAVLEGQGGGAADSATGGARSSIGSVSTALPAAPDSPGPPPPGHGGPSTPAPARQSVPSAGSSPLGRGVLTPPNSPMGATSPLIRLYTHVLRRPAAEVGPWRKPTSSAAARALHLLSRAMHAPSPRPWDHFPALDGLVSLQLLHTLCSLQQLAASRLATPGGLDASGVASMQRCADALLSAIACSLIEVSPYIAEHVACNQELCRLLLSSIGPFGGGSAAMRAVFEHGSQPEPGTAEQEHEQSVRRILCAAVCGVVVESAAVSAPWAQIGVEHIWGWADDTPLVTIPGGGLIGDVGVEGEIMPPPPPPPGTAALYPSMGGSSAPSTPTTAAAEEVWVTPTGAEEGGSASPSPLSRSPASPLAPPADADWDGAASDKDDGFTERHRSEVGGGAAASAPPLGASLDASTHDFPVGMTSGGGLVGHGSNVGQQAARAGSVLQDMMLSPVHEEQGGGHVAPRGNRHHHDDTYGDESFESDGSSYDGEGGQVDNSPPTHTTIIVRAGGSTVQLGLPQQDARGGGSNRSSPHRSPPRRRGHSRQASRHDAPSGHSRQASRHDAPSGHSRQASRHDAPSGHSRQASRHDAPSGHSRQASRHDAPSGHSRQASRHDAPSGHSRQASRRVEGGQRRAHLPGPDRDSLSDSSRFVTSRRGGWRGGHTYDSDSRSPLSDSPEYSAELEGGANSDGGGGASRPYRPRHNRIASMQHSSITRRVAEAVTQAQQAATEAAVHAVTTALSSAGGGTLRHHRSSTMPTMHGGGAAVGYGGEGSGASALDVSATMDPVGDGPSAPFSGEPHQDEIKAPSAPPSSPGAGGGASSKTALR